MTGYLHEDLTYTIIGAYYEVWNHTARTYPEYIYERAMMRELQAHGIICIRQPKYEIVYKDQLVGRQELDIFVADEVVVENKATDSITHLHKAQAISYLKTVDKSVGLVLNFGGSEPEFARVYWNGRSGGAENSDPSDLPGAISDEWIHADLAYDIVGGLFEVHRILGPGFVHRIYTNACDYELRLRGLSTKPMKEFQVYYKGRPLGKLKFAHILVEGAIMVFPVAAEDVKRIRIENLRTWMKAQRIELGILANFRTASLDPVFMRV